MVNKQKQLAFSALSEWDLASHYLTAGLEYEGDDVTTSNIAFPYDPAKSYSSSRAKVKQYSLEAFAQDEWSLTEALKATIGVRFSHIQGKYVEREGISYKDGSSSNQKASHVVGSLGLVYRGIKNWAFRAQFSQGYRYPTVRQLYTGNSAHGGGSYLSPNPNLKAETSNNFEIGARYMDEHWDIDLAVFLTQSKNFIDSISATNNPTGIGTYVNGDKARTVGAELSLSYAIQYDDITMTPYASGAFLQRKITLNQGKNYINNPQSTSKTALPPLEGTIGFKMDKKFGESHSFYADLFARMAVKTKSKFSDPAGGGASATIAKDYTIYPAWQTFNLTLGISGGEDHKYRITLALRNIFNQSYVMSMGRIYLNEPGFHMLLGVGVDI
jgi:hemoglobin/transferrin/lactoferrin receptor protein